MNTQEGLRETSNTHIQIMFRHEHLYNVHADMNGEAGEYFISIITILDNGFKCTIQAKECTIPAKNCIIKAKDCIIPAKDIIIKAKECTIPAKDIIIKAKE